MIRCYRCDAFFCSWCLWQLRLVRLWLWCRLWFEKVKKKHQKKIDDWSTNESIGKKYRTLDDEKCAKSELSNFLMASGLSKSFDSIHEHADSGSPAHFTKYSSWFAHRKKKRKNDDGEKKRNEQKCNNAISTVIWDALINQLVSPPSR